MEEFKSYYDYLKETINGFKGEFDLVVLYLPEFFKLLTDTLNEDDISSDDRLRICAVLGYFVAPYDVIPEEIYGPAGFMDDLFLCTYVLKEIKEKYGLAMLDKYWFLEDDLDEVLEQAYEYSKGEIEKKGIINDILKYIGLDTL